MRQETTIKSLNAIPIPEIPYPYDQRIAPQELTLYRVKGRLLARKIESDSDIHLVISEADAEAMTMIVEIPAPECALGTGLESKYEAARKEASSAPLRSIIMVEGVGFFDFIHNQSGRAKNGFELHPVLSIKRP